LNELNAVAEERYEEGMKIISSLDIPTLLSKTCLSSGDDKEEEDDVEEVISPTLFSTFPLLGIPISVKDQYSQVCFKFQKFSIE